MNLNNVILIDTLYVDTRSVRLFAGVTKTMQLDFRTLVTIDDLAWHTEIVQMLHACNKTLTNMSAGRDSSQSNWSFYNSWINILAITTTGASNPSGSNI